jgi:excisionase family DNA binding protein
MSRELGRSERVAFDIIGAAEAASVSVTYLRREVHSGRLPAKKVGRKYMIGALELRQWFEQLPDAD